MHVVKVKICYDNMQYEASPGTSTSVKYITSIQFHLDADEYEKVTTKDNYLRLNEHGHATKTSRCILYKLDEDELINRIKVGYDPKVHSYLYVKFSTDKNKKVEFGQFTDSTEVEHILVPYPYYLVGMESMMFFDPFS